MAISGKGAHFPPEIIRMGVRWYVAYPLSYWHVEALLEERGVEGDHATIQRGVVQYRPRLEEAAGPARSRHPGGVARSTPRRLDDSNGRLQVAPLWATPLAQLSRS